MPCKGHPAPLEGELCGLQKTMADQMQVSSGVSVSLKLVLVLWGLRPDARRALLLFCYAVWLIDFFLQPRSDLDQEGPGWVFAAPLGPAAGELISL